MSFVATRPVYNFAHWVPHNLLRDLGVPYATVLWAEQNSDYLLHFGGGFALTVLLRWSELPLTGQSVIRCVITVAALCFAAEIYQYLIDRGAETSDLLLGISGCFMAYLALFKNH